MSEAGVSVERLAQYSPEDAAGIGRLMPYLSEAKSGEPIDPQLLQAIIDSPYHEQFVARLHGVIVGAATLSLMMGPAVGREAYLEDFVTDPEVRRKGVGDRLWQMLMTWCREQNVNLSFTSHPRREAAQRFYLHHGAEIRETNVFHVDTSESSE